MNFVFKLARIQCIIKNICMNINNEGCFQMLQPFKIYAGLSQLFSTTIGSFIANHVYCLRPDLITYLLAVPALVATLGWYLVTFFLWSYSRATASTEFYLMRRVNLWWNYLQKKD